MIFTDYYKAKQLNPESKSRYDVILSSDSYDLFELLNNKRGFNKNGKSFSYCKVPDKWNFKDEKRKPEKAITKNGKNISSIFIKDFKYPIGFGDINNSNDGLIVIFDYSEQTIELFIARGQANFIENIYETVIENILIEEMNILREKAIKIDVFE